MPKTSPVSFTVSADVADAPWYIALTFVVPPIVPSVRRPPDVIDPNVGSTLHWTALVTSISAPLPIVA